MIITDKNPFYVKISLITVGLFAFISMLFIAQGLIVPLIYATLIAIVLSPIVNFLVAKKMNRILAITFTLTAVIIVSFTIISLLSAQAANCGDALPKLSSKSVLFMHQTELWVSKRFNLHIDKVHTWFEEANTAVVVAGKSMLGKTLVNIGNVLVVLFLIPVYTFLVLFYQPLIIEFIHKLFNASSHIVVNEVLSSAKKIIQSYLVGLVLEAVIVAAMNVTSLLIIGIDYAIVLGVIGAVLNVIPYIGGIIAVGLPMIIAISTKSPTAALLVLVAYIVIQFIDNHIIIPRVVASKVQINALVSIIVVLAGGALWGVGGMFLSIPLTAILKVIFDHIDGLKPWGFLLGNVVDTSAKSIFYRARGSRK